MRHTGLPMGEFLKTYGPIAISCLALVVSTLSWRVSHRQERRSVTAKLPYATASIEPIAAQPHWYSVKVRVESRDAHGLSRRDSYESARQPDGRAPLLKSPLPLEIATRQPSLQLSLTKAGIDR